MRSRRYRVFRNRFHSQTSTQVSGERLAPEGPADGARLVKRRRLGNGMEPIEWVKTRLICKQDTPRENDVDGTSAFGAWPR